MNNFNITVKDNFFEKKEFEKIYENIDSLSYGSADLTLDKNYFKHVFPSSKVPKDVQEIIVNKTEKLFNVKVDNITLCKYTMVSKVEKPLIHNDIGDENDFQTIIYIKGNSHIHCGTCFYDQNKDGSFRINSHIGFKENRIVSWSPDIFHAPMSFTNEFKPRFSIITQFKLKNNL